MRLARIKTADGPQQVAFRDGRWHAINDIFADTLEFTGEYFTDGEVSFLIPTAPRIVLGMAHNGSKDELKHPPQAFQKSSRTAIGPNEAIYKDESLGQMNVECELATVIKRTARNLNTANAMEHVLGFTIGNDITLPDQTPMDSLLLQSKNGDGFTPLGPWIETQLTDVDNKTIYVNVNGKRVIETSTNQLARGVPEQLVYITKYMTLEAGDVILGGSPMSMFAVNVGDSVDLEIEGIGVLSNTIVKR